MSDLDWIVREMPWGLAGIAVILISGYIFTRIWKEFPEKK